MLYTLIPFFFKLHLFSLSWVRIFLLSCHISFPYIPPPSLLLLFFALRISFGAVTEEIKYVLQTYFGKMYFHDPHSPKACREQNVFPETHAVWRPQVSSQPQAVGWALFYREKVAFLMTFYGIIKASSSLCPPWGVFGLLVGAFVSRPFVLSSRRVQRPFFPYRTALSSWSALFCCLRAWWCFGPHWWILLSSSSLSLLSHQRPGTLVGGNYSLTFSSRHQNSNMLWVLTNCILHNAKLHFVISIFFSTRP